MAEITTEIIEHFGTLSASGHFEKQVNAVSWNGGEPVLDIRSWDTETGRARKGVTITAAEAPALIEAARAFLAWIEPRANQEE